jgi:pimeloyl-ACP methyl ester carboxylesterase
VALLSALEMPDQFQAVITWSAISNLYRYSDEEIKQWLKRGYIEVENKRTGQIMKLNKTFWNDLDRNKKKFNLESRMGKLDIPALFIHGLLDTSVPCEESQNLHEWCGAFQKRLELIEEADHTYNIRHPFNGINPVYDLCCNLSESWLDNAFLL